MQHEKQIPAVHPDNGRLHSGIRGDGLARARLRASAVVRRRHSRAERLRATSVPHESGALLGNDRLGPVARRRAARVRLRLDREPGRRHDRRDRRRIRRSEDRIRSRRLQQVFLAAALHDVERLLQEALRERQEAARRRRLVARDVARRRMGARDRAEGEDRARRSGVEQLQRSDGRGGRGGRRRRLRRVDELRRQRIQLGNRLRQPLQRAVARHVRRIVRRQRQRHRISGRVAVRRRGRGTTLAVDASGNYIGETAWSGSGGGVSTYEPEPSGQALWPIPYAGSRGVPDVAYDANPSSGFAVYDSVTYQGQSGWFVVGGTSAGAPQWAALFAIANSMRAAAGKATLAGPYNQLYTVGKLAYGSDYHDITSGTNGGCGTICTASGSYDYVTGLGSPQALNLVQALVAQP
ncbi:putative peptidase S8 and S53 subtilisin kexin sedolisin [Burkholderia thailandensis]|uniref:Peptidase S8 and S53 subtilisin kexin sedolisin n=1 Tax=Burkholderia thailandensis TaxID=57975 RepID=A0AAW9D2N3_BURTH|nr:putative peptidase S8 and S53 subtilisin kexin sedolisin [Burkholderia thailandensis]